MATDRAKPFRVILCCGLLLLPIGCGGYPEVSPTTYEISKALFSICNQQNSEKLAKVTELIEESRTSGKITDDEAEWLSAIVSDAREGDWDACNQEVRQLMEDQVQR